MKNIFNSTKHRRAKKNNFDLSHEKKLSMKMGGLYPCLLQEVIPTDEFQVKTESLVRLAPLVSPMMHRVDCHIHYFFVPHRLIWNEWEDFITGGDNGEALPSFPRIGTGSPNLTAKRGVGDLLDYLGVPPSNSNSDFFISQMPMRAYQTIFNEFYRDQNLQDEIDVPLGSGNTSDATIINNLCTLRTRNWEKDYFTSCLPEPQKGPEVTLPLGDTADIDWRLPNDGSNLGDVSRDSVTGANYPANPAGASYNIETGPNGNTIANNNNISVDNSRFLEADLSTATAATINDLRKATAVQRWLETAMRGGSRYVEQLWSHFGTKAGDARLQRPEYLGGGKTPIVISEVLNQYNSSANANDAPVGDMSGHGIAVSNNYGFTKKFTEHGYIMGIMSVLPKTAYFQGLHKSWFKFDKFQYYFPTFANLGEEEVLNIELYDQGAGGTNLEAFGYQQRYADYKTAFSTVHGDFRTNLNHYHMSRQFENTPVLNNEFVESDPTDRVFAVQDGTDTLWCQIYHDVKALRPIPYHADPRLS